MPGKDLRVIIKSEELITHTLIITSNSNRYPKKYRHSLCDRMQLISFDIYENLLEANRTLNTTHRQERCEKITKAITSCDKLLAYIKISLNINLLNSSSAAYWTSLVTDVKHLALAWRKSENNK